MKRAVLVIVSLLLTTNASAQDESTAQTDTAQTDTVATDTAATDTVAQTAEVERPEAPDRWGFETNLSLTSTSGNDQITVFVSSGKITHLQTSAFKLEVGGRIRYGRSGGEDVAQNMQTTLTVEIGPKAPWSPFVFGSAEKDPFKRLDLRTSGGAGVRYQLVRRDAAEFMLSGAALHSYENLRLEQVDPLVPPDDVTHNARWRWVAKGKATMLDQAVEASHETYYEPVWDHGDDYLMEVENTVRFRFSDHLAFRVAHVFQRDSSPPEDVDQNDQMLTVGVSYNTKF
ncbi:MAG TPA: DUF481 domain-containing protein [Longimicrobiales bacterium]|nr:DUF481 domain-containing protein [Longimicrobiales bacterium]